MKASELFNSLFAGSLPWLGLREIGVAVVVCEMLATAPANAGNTQCGLPMEAVLRNLSRYEGEAGDVEAIVDGLVDRGVLSVDDRGFVTSGYFSGLLDHQRQLKQRRSAGWVKRKGSLPVSAAHPPAPAKRKAAPTALEAPEEALGGPDELVASIVCKTGQEVKVMRSWLIANSKAFPALVRTGDIERQALLAANWCRTNGERRKTVGGVPRFLLAWLGTAETRAMVSDTLSHASKNTSNGFGRGGNQEFLIETPADAGVAVQDAGEQSGLEILENIAGGSPDDAGKNAAYHRNSMPMPRARSRGPRPGAGV